MSTTRSPMPYLSPPPVQHLSVDDINSHPQDSAWYGTSMPATAPYEQFGFSNPYVTPSVSSAGFSPMPEQSKSTSASMNLTTTAGDTSNFPTVSEAYSIDYSRPPTNSNEIFPRVSIPSYLELPRSYETSYNYNRSNDNTHFYGFTAPYDSLPQRPRSSPSVFSPVTPGGSRLSDHFAWPSNANALGISHGSLDETMLTGHGHGSIMAPSPPQSSSAHTPEMLAPQPRRMYAPIAPHPLSLQRLATSKRVYDDDSEMTDATLKRRKASTSSSGMAGSQFHEVGEEDRLLLKLKDDENLPWKEIAARFQTDLGKNYQIPALQMRLKRLKERLRVWTDADVKALRMAHDYWRENKFEIIAAKMMEFGATDRWSTKQCARKWAEIDPSATPFITTQDDSQQVYSYTSSPTETSSYMPYLHVP